MKSFISIGFPDRYFLLFRSDLPFSLSARAKQSSQLSPGGRWQESSTTVEQSIQSVGQLVKVLKFISATFRQALTTKAGPCNNFRTMIIIISAGFRDKLASYFIFRHITIFINKARKFFCLFQIYRIKILLCVVQFSLNYN